MNLIDYIIMETNNISSEFLKLNWKDFLKGVIMAVLGAVITLIYTTISNGGVIDWVSIGNVALVSGLGYIVKNYFSTSDGKFLGKIG